MKNRKIEFYRLFLTLGICILFLAISFTSVIGHTPSDNINIEENKNFTITKPISKPALPDFFYKIFNNDWNYWTNSPNMYSIPIGNIGIGVPNPTEKLDVAGTIKMTGFFMPTGANNGYVLTSDGTGRGTWQYYGMSDGHSLDSVDGDPQDVVFVGEDGSVTINTSGTLLSKSGEEFKDPPTVTIETEGSQTNIIGANSYTAVGEDMQVDIGKDLNVNVGGATEINSGNTLKIVTGAGTTIVGTVTIDGKLNALGGVDPPYMSYSKESHDSIREYAQDVNDHEEVMQFWNGESHRMEVYVISEDAFYTICGELIEE